MICSAIGEATEIVAVWICARFPRQKQVRFRHGDLAGYIFEQLNAQGHRTWGRKTSPPISETT